MVNKLKKPKLLIKYSLLIVAVILLSLTLFACVNNNNNNNNTGAVPSIAGVSLERSDGLRPLAEGQMLAVRTQEGTAGMRDAEDLNVVVDLHNAANLEIVSLRINSVLVLSDGFSVNQTRTRVTVNRHSFSVPAPEPANPASSEFLVEITDVRYRTANNNVRSISPLANNRTRFLIDPVFSINYIVDKSQSATGEGLNETVSIPFLARITTAFLLGDVTMNNRVLPDGSDGFVKENWGFMGWFTQPNGQGERVRVAHSANNAQIFDFNQNITLFAHFLPFFEYEVFENELLDGEYAVITGLTDAGKSREIFRLGTDSVMEPYINGLPIVKFADRSLDGLPADRLTLPTHLVEIGKSVFEDRHIHVTLNQNLQIIGEAAFKNNTALQSGSSVFVLPSGLREIHAEAFVGCNWQTEFMQSTVIIPNGLTILGRRAFMNSGFSTVFFETNSQLVLFGDEVFRGSEELLRVDTETDGSGIAIVPQLGNGLKKIPQGTFFGCFKITTLRFAGGLEVIGDSAFQTGARRNNELTTVSFPASLREIGNFAFSNATKLRNITFAPATAASESDTFKIGNQAFSTIAEELDGDAVRFIRFRFLGRMEFGTAPFLNNTQLRIVEFDAPLAPVFANGLLSGNNERYIRFLVPFGIREGQSQSIKDEYTQRLNASISNNYTLHIFAKGEDNLPLEFSGNTGSSERDMRFGFIPWEINGINGIKIVYVVGEYRTLTLTNPASINFGNISSEHGQIISIGTHAFSLALTSVVLPLSLREIDDHAFFRCANLTSVNFADLNLLETIGREAFSQTAITSFRSGAALREIGIRAFYLCRSLQEVYVVKGRAIVLSGNTETEGIAIRAEAFANIVTAPSVLQKVFLGENVRAIGVGAFAGNRQLTTVVINRFRSSEPAVIDMGTLPLNPPIFNSTHNNLTFFLPSMAIRNYFAGETVGGNTVHNFYQGFSYEVFLPEHQKEFE
jgi:hypothetical protein